MKRHWKSGSTLVEKLFDNVEKYRKIEVECYKTCNEILSDETVDMDELYHAKAALEQKMDKRTSMKDFVGWSFSVIAILLSGVAVVVSGADGKFGIMESLIVAILPMAVCLIIYYFTDKSPVKNYMYYVHSLICTEIEKRNNRSEKLTKKTNGKNKKSKNKKGKK